MPPLEIGPNREITLTSAMLNHVSLPRGGKLVAKKLPDGTIVLRAKRKWSSALPALIGLLWRQGPRA